MKILVRALLIVIPILLIAIVSFTASMKVRMEELIEEENRAMREILRGGITPLKQRKFCELIRLNPSVLQQSGAITWAARHCDLETNELVLKMGGDMIHAPEGEIHPPIINALWRREPELFALYLSAGVDPNESIPPTPFSIRSFFRDPLERQSTHVWEPLLHAACREGNLEIVELLLQAGADIQGRNPVGETCLFTATQWRHQEVVRLLLRRGIDADLASDDGETVESWLRANKVDAENAERWPEMAEILAILTHWREHGSLPQS